MTSKIFRAVIMGAPGSGKGTIATRIMKDFELKYLSSGDLLRKQIYEKSVNGITAKRYIDSGELVPDHIMTRMIMYELSNMQKDSWMLDGFPRTVTQAQALLRDEPLDLVINLRVPFETIIDRIKGRMIHTASGRIYHTEFNPPKEPGKDDVTGEPLITREDDKEETVKARLEHYRRLTHPVLSFYSNKGMVEEFAGKYSNEIWPKVHECLVKFIEAKQYTHYD